MAKKYGKRLSVVVTPELRDALRVLEKGAREPIAAVVRGVLVRAAQLRAARRSKVLVVS